MSPAIAVPNGVTPGTRVVVVGGSEDGKTGKFIRFTRVLMPDGRDLLYPAVRLDYSHGVTIVPAVQPIKETTT